MKSRRDFIKLGSLALVGGLAAAGNLNVFGQSSMTDDYFQIPTQAFANRMFSVDDFEPLLDQLFFVSDKKAKVRSTLRLVEVVRGSVKMKSLDKRATERFNLIFEVQGKSDLTDKIYRISNPALGDYEIFISTVGRSGKRFQAVFTRVYL